MPQCKMIAYGKKQRLATTLLIDKFFFIFSKIVLVPDWLIRRTKKWNSFAPTNETRLSLGQICSQEGSFLAHTIQLR